MGHAIETGQAGAHPSFARRAVIAGLALRLARKRGGPWVHHLASVLYLAAALGFRFAWVTAGQASSNDDEAVALSARWR